MASQVAFEEIRCDDDDALRDWYDIYKIAFPHPDEQEPIEFFRHILEMNEDGRLRERLGLYHEYVLAVRDLESGKIIGGLNIGVTTSDAHRAAGLAASVHAIFLFIAPDYRNRLGRQKFLEEIRARGLAAFPPKDGEPDKIGILFEVNNPLEMELDELQEDYANSGVDTYHRYAAWLQIGWPLQFPYVQPALSTDKEPVHFLHLFYAGPGKGESIPAQMLRNHLHAFISYSVLKGEDAQRNPEFAQMAAWLDQRRTVDFIPQSSPAIAEIRGEARARDAIRRTSRARAETSLDLPVADSAYAMPGGLRNVLDETQNTLFRLGHYLFDRIEPRHILMAYVELATLAWGLVSSLIFVTSHFAQSSREMIEYLDILLFSGLAIYVGTRTLVQQRRDRLGPAMGKVWKEFRKRYNALSGWRGAHGWLEQELAVRAGKLSSSGYVIGPDVPVQDRNARLGLLASCASTIYSQHVWTGEDAVFRDGEYQWLQSSTDEFREGLWGARFQSCPERIFVSQVVPVDILSGQIPVDLDFPKIDYALARRLSGKSLEAADAAGAVPCLLLSRQMASYSLANERRGAAIDAQFDQFLASLLHLSDILSVLAAAGDLQHGLRPCSIRWVTGSKTHIALLETYGFQPIQQPPAHESPEGHGKPSRMHAKIYALTVGGTREEYGQQQFRQLLARVRDARDRGSRSSRP